MHITLRKSSSRKSVRSTSSRLSSTRATRPSRSRTKTVEEDESDSLLKIEGVIISMVRILEHFTIRDRQNNRFVRLTWTPKTRFLRQGKSAASTALRVGQPVKVSCDLADKGLLADVVTITPAAVR